MTLADFLTFTRRERSGIVVLVVLMVVFALAPRLVCSPPQVNVSITDQQMSTLSAAANAHFRTDSVTKIANNSRKEAYRYNAAHDKEFQKSFADHGARRPPSSRLRRIEINSADTSVLIALPGIGSKLASRILLFRDKLGGYYSVSQVSEVFGLKDSVFQIIRPFLVCDTGKVKRLNLNVADKEQLRQHPYIRWQGANAIVAYRQQHGPFESVADIERIQSLDSATRNRILPYLTVF